MPSLESRLVYLLLRVARRRRKFESVENLRRYISGISREAPVPARLRARFRVGEHEVQGRPVVELAPKHGGARRHVVYLHGGGYVNVILKQHWQFLGRLLGATSVTATVPLYGLAPKHTYKEAFTFLAPVYASLVERHGAENLVLMGDSAGGGLALAFAQAMLEKRFPLPQPRCIVLIFPWLDVTMSNPDIASVVEADMVLAVPGLREAGRLWAGGDDPNLPALSPINGPLAGLAPMCLVVGTRDLCVADARRFRDKARIQGATLQYQEYDGMIHGWVLLPLPESRQALRQIVAFMDNPASGVG